MKHFIFTTIFKILVRTLEFVGIRLNHFMEAVLRYIYSDSIFIDAILLCIARTCSFCYVLFYRNSDHNMTTTDSRGNGGLARGLADVTDLCQECNFPYDKGKKRKLIDACGHEKCWACMVKQEECQICAKSKM